MKKKMIIVAALCVLGSFAGVLIRSEAAEAKNKVTCTISGSSATSKKDCAEKLNKVKTVKSTCTSKVTEQAKGCKNAIEDHLQCGTELKKNKTECSKKKGTYADDVKAELLSLNNTDKTDSDKTDDSKDSGDTESGDTGSSALDPITEKEGNCTSLLPNSWCDQSNGENGITNIAGLIVGILTGMVLTAGTIGLIICGYIWLTAQDNAAKVEMAKKRMLDIVIGLVAWVLLAALANLIIPQSESTINSNYDGGSSSSSGDTEK